MNSNYIYDYINLFERVLSAGYKKDYSTSALERNVSYSLFFKAIEKDSYSFSPIISETSLVKNIFPELDVNIKDVPIYNQCLWAAEAYLRIEQATKLTFECIFLYIPISKMYSYFDLYHEMSFNHIIDEFNRLYKDRSVLSLLIEKFRYSVNYISGQTGISKNTLYSLKQRRRDIRKVNVGLITKLANLFRVQIETIAEVKI